jgi:hypothetical protein
VSHRRTSEDVISFYNWLVDYAPWLVRLSSPSIERVRELVAADIASADEIGACGPKSPRRGFKRLRGR